jgi:integrase
MLEVGGSIPSPPTNRLLQLTVLSREQIERLENVARNERDKVIVRLLADTGIRAS